MTSEARFDEAYVWVWLPGGKEPVVAGRLARDGDRLVFNYGRSYLARENAIPLYEPELPLRPGVILPEPGLSMASCLRDAAPDAWGRRVILNRLAGRAGPEADVASLDELTYLLESGSDRVGALDFQRSARSYVPRLARSATLKELMTAAERVERGLPLPPDLDAALFHGTSLGGARPKALVTEVDRKLIAKFSSSTDVFDVVKAEFVAMRIAARVGIRTAPVQLARAAGRDVLLVERFDRVRMEDGWRRKAMVSALTLLGLDEMAARYASYETLAEIVRMRFDDPKGSLRELFARMTFNILCGNTDDHARNHAAFWDGASLSFTPAYDVCPQVRTGGEASQAMSITGAERLSRLATCIRAAPAFLMDAASAEALIADQIRALKSAWADVCTEAGLGAAQQDLLRTRAFLAPVIFEGAPEPLRALAERA
ncbi:type II toxin-antitoxin system HipA family toxin [Salinarimonas sp.]|uniref:type II toxin-antitoxin system HipA family toxin n=1 Tax=Salinarimonas sp. TaxID=2766526 RepID=UPI0032D8C1C2